MVGQVKTEAEVTVFVCVWQASFEKREMSSGSFNDLSSSKAAVELLDEVAASAPDALNMTVRVQVERRTA